MKILLLCITLLVALGTTAQTYEWQWAKRGGGVYESYQESGESYAFDSEQIKDIVVDSNNNYYYLAFITYGNTEYEGTIVPVYNSPAGCDVLLISTDCEGTLRWTQTIGGGAQDYAYKLGLDNNGGLYLTVNTLNTSGPYPNTYLPPHFSPTDSLPVVEENTDTQLAHKTGALLKYNTSNGTLAWRKMLQGDVNLNNRSIDLSQVQVDSNGIIHVLVGFLKGTHLDGMAIVPDDYTDKYKFFIAKFNSAGTVLSAMEIPLGGSFLEHHSDFRYDENLQRYYLAGFRFTASSNVMVNFSYNNTAFQYQAFVLALNNTGTELWRKEVSSSPSSGWNEIHDIKIDSDSNIYVAGKSFSTSFSQVLLGDYPFPPALNGNVMYLMKLNASGAVQWVKTPSGYTNVLGQSGNEDAYSLAINGNEVALACQGTYTIWDNVSMTRADNHLSDPVLVRFNKATGNAIAMHDISGTAGYIDALTAVTKDNDGNYVVGGYFRNSLFTTSSAVSAITKVQGQTSFTDFFMAKLAAGPCGTLHTESTLGATAFKLYPNPSSGKIYFETAEKLDSYEIFDLQGKRLVTGIINEGQSSISIQNLSSGTYIIKLKTSNGTVMTDKIIRR